VEISGVRINAFLVMNRLHCTSLNTLELSMTYKQIKDGYKPRGLWYALENEWLEWCFGNMPHWIKENTVKLEIDNSKIITITTFKDLISFNNTYKTNPFDDNFITYIDWEQVAKDYTGIEVHNYHQIKWKDSNMLLPSWFYGLDVSGGCIWDLSIIKKTTVFPTPKKWFKLEKV
jgi:hypothetical protein